jgi:hypothetical protein
LGYGDGARRRELGSFEIMVRFGLEQDRRQEGLDGSKGKKGPAKRLHCSPKAGISNTARIVAQLTRAACLMKNQVACMLASGQDTLPHSLMMALKKLVAADKAGNR